jgi:hypothetical protein
VLAHRERIEMIRNGYTYAQMNRPGATMPPPPPGFVPPPGAVPPPHVPPYYAYDPNYDAQRQLRKGIRVAFVGMALLIGLSFIGHSFGPWLLAGLVPLFVGIAQVITAILGGARIAGIGPSGSVGFGPPPPGGPSANVPPYAAGPRPAPPSGPPGWRPGPTPEIEKPAQPPDYRR